MGPQEVALARRKEPEHVSKVNAKAGPPPSLSRAWVGGPDRLPCDGNPRNRFAFPAAYRCLRNDGVNGSSPLSGTTTSTRQIWCSLLGARPGGRTETTWRKLSVPRSRCVTVETLSHRKLLVSGLPMLWRGSRSIALRKHIPQDGALLSIEEPLGLSGS